MDLDDLIPDVAIDVKDCPRALMIRELVAAARQFCVYTKVWEEDVGSITPVAGITEYQLDLPPGSDLVAVTGDLDAEVMPPDRVIFLESPQEIVPIRASLQPSYGATTLPDVIASQWREAVVSGAIARLLMMNGRPWADPQLSSYHRDISVGMARQAVSRKARIYGATLLRSKQHGRF